MRAQTSPGGTVVRFVADGTPIPDGWVDFPCADIGADLQPGPGERLAGPVVTVTDEGVTRVWEISAKPDDALWADIRARRDALLLESDRASLARWADRWAAQTDGWRDAWTAYRTALRDLPETFAAAGPLAVVWPDPPS